ncbi:PLDc N-terminal domain-containing protein, partial [Dermatophilus congolensis]
NVVIRVLGTLLILAYSIYTLVDCLNTDEQHIRALPKPIWALGICLFPIVGGTAWWLAGRPQRPRPQRPIGPDDDPDFLRGL